MATTTTGIFSSRTSTGTGRLGRGIGFSEVAGFGAAVAIGQTVPTLQHGLSSRIATAIMLEVAELIHFIKLLQHLSLSLLFSTIISLIFSLFGFFSLPFFLLFSIPPGAGAFQSDRRLISGVHGTE